MDTRHLSTSTRRRAQGPSQAAPEAFLLCSRSGGGRRMDQVGLGGREEVSMCLGVGSFGVCKYGRWVLNRGW